MAQKTLNDTRLERVLELAVLGTVLALPLYFNPFALDPFERPKATLVWGVAAGCLALLWLWWLRNPAERRLDVRGLFWPIIAYAVIYLLATAGSVDVIRSLSHPHGTLTLLSGVVFFGVVAVTWRTQAQLERLVTVIILASIPVALYGWGQYWQLDVLDWRTTSISAVHSTLGRSIFLGAYLALVIPLTLMRLWVDRPKRLAYALIVCLQFGCLLFTQARGAWLGTLAAGLLLAALALGPGRHRVRLIVIPLLLLVGLVTFTLVSRGNIPLLGTRIQLNQRWLEVPREGSNAVRLWTWSHALALIPERPWLGYGPETFAEVFRRFYALRDPEVLAVAWLDRPHNVILNHLTAVGWLGFLAFLWLVTQFYASLLAALPATTETPERMPMIAVMSAMTAYLVQAQFNPNVVVLSVYFWVLLGMGRVLLRLAQDR